MNLPSPQSEPPSRLSAFLSHEAAAGIIVMLAAALALVVDNSPLSGLYGALLDTPVQIRVGALALDKTVLLVINDGLMAVFFLLVGLEIKREVLRGELSTRAQALLPLIAAIGGMVVPALVYAAVTVGNAVALRGWAIPAATDIAFALAVLALLGARVPASLKVFLLALAIIDDLGAIIIIALFYTADLSALALGVALTGVAVLGMLNRAGVTRLAPYMIIGVLIWLAVLKSGVHATLAGVAVAFAIPLAARDYETSPLERLEHALHPWVAYGILPLFAFANAGMPLAGLTLAKALQPIPLGIILGLCMGKPIGIVGATWLGVRAGLVSLPTGASWAHMIGVGMLAGIGFTMSLFIGTLAFPDPAYAVSIRIGVLAGSIISACCGYVLLRRLPTS